MAIIFKLAAVLASIAATVFLTVEGVQRGLLLVSTIFGIFKFIVILAFCSLLILILYLLLTSKPPHPPEAPE